jgi:hypothetical protein
VLAACGTEGGSTASAPVAASAPSVDQTVPVKIGYFPNLTHAPGLVADAEGFFEKRIGAGKASVTAFNARARGHSGAVQHLGGHCLYRSEPHRHGVRQVTRAGGPA